MKHTLTWRTALAAGLALTSAPSLWLRAAAPVRPPSSGASHSTIAASTQASVAGGCGNPSKQLPPDPDGVLAKLPQADQAGYDYFPQAVHASAWANWKPSHPGPYTVYFSPGNVSSAYTAQIAAEFKTLSTKNPDVIGKVVVDDSNNVLQTQIQQIQQAISQKVDLIVVLPLSTTAEAPVFDAAGKAGIPVIALLSPSTSPYVVGVDGNNPQFGATLAENLVKLFGAKANVLNIHGIPSVPSDAQLFQGAAAVFKDCPNIQTAGEITGQYQNAVAKSTTIQFLTAHPQSVEAMLEVGGMAVGVMQAFQQAGRPVPAVAGVSAEKGVMAYWNQNKDTYKAVELARAPGPVIADATWSIALAMFAGRGVKITDISQAPVLITKDNLSQWVQPDWTLDTPGTAPAPAGTFYTSSFLDAFYTNQK